MLPEDLAVELAEDREWDNLRDTVERFHEELDEEKTDEEKTEPKMTRDEPRFRFADE
jgi:hypothetical protein